MFQVCEWVLGGSRYDVLLGGFLYVRCFRSDCMYGDAIARLSYRVLSMAFIDATVPSLSRSRFKLRTGVSAAE